MGATLRYDVGSLYAESDLGEAYRAIYSIDTPLARSVRDSEETESLLESLLTLKLNKSEQRGEASNGFTTGNDSTNNTIRTSCEDTGNSVENDYGIAEFQRRLAEKQRNSEIKEKDRTESEEDYGSNVGNDASSIYNSYNTYDGDLDYDEEDIDEEIEGEIDEEVTDEYDIDIDDIDFDEVDEDDIEDIDDDYEVGDGEYEDADDDIEVDDDDYFDDSEDEYEELGDVLNKCAVESIDKGRVLLRNEAEDKKSEVTGNVVSNSNEINSRDKKKDVAEQKIDYTSLSIDDVFKYHMKPFLERNGVRKSPVAYDKVKGEFGEDITQKLIRKKYILKFKNGVTMGL